MPAGPELDDQSILALRGIKNPLDPRIPYAFLVEPEMTAAGTVESVATVFLTNRECPFRCLFCDLWKNTIDARVPLGAIPLQIEHALTRLPDAAHIKLYNSGNFFDHQAIPPGDYAAIAGRVARFRTVIVENHPQLCGRSCLEFRDLLNEFAMNQGPAGDGAREACAPPPQLEVGLGLETVHPEILPRLNKRMTLDDFRRAAAFLVSHGVAVRAFILLKPPYMSPAECVAWSLKSLEFAFDCGARVCSVIPTRAGNGVMDQLQRDGRFAPPRLAALEETLACGIAMGRGRVFVDLWDVERFSTCSRCAPARIARLRQMNLLQKTLPEVECSCF